MIKIMEYLFGWEKVITYIRGMVKIGKTLPKRFSLFSTVINVEFDNKRLNDKGMYGLSDYGSSKILLSDMEGLEPLSNDRVMDTFYHERTHAILDAMNETDLSNNEKFVDVFSKLLRQADVTAEF